MPSRKKLKNAKPSTAREVSEVEISRMLSNAESMCCKLEDLENLSVYILSSPSAHFAKAMKIFCGHLDSIEVERKTESLAARQRKREFALVSLRAFANAACAPQPHIAEAQPIFRRSWPKVLAWFQYFYSETTSEDMPDSWTSEDAIILLSGALMFVSRDEDLFQSAICNDGLLALIVKIWVLSDDIASTLEDRILKYVTVLFQDGFNCAIGKNWETADAARSTIVKAAGGDADNLVKRIMGYLRPPARPDNYVLAALILRIALTMIAKDFDKRPVTPTEYMDIFIKHDVVARASRYLSLASSTPSSRDIPSDERFRTKIVEDSIPILMSAMMSRSGPHSTMIILKHGFLHSVTNLLSTSPHILDIDDDYQDMFDIVFTTSIPAFLVHRPVVLQAIKALKEIAADRDASNSIETSFLKDAWGGFSQTVLERTIFNAIYTRDFPEEAQDEKRCYTCQRTEDDLGADLRKCSGCETALYCSRECQTAAWKEYNHKNECKKLKMAWNVHGIKLRKNDFLCKLAIMDIRRHADALKSLLTEDASLKEVALQDIVIFVCYAGTTAPWFKFVHIQDASKALGENEVNRSALGADEMHMVLKYFRGGNLPMMEVQEIPTSIIADARAGVRATPKLGMSNPPPGTREPGRTYNGLRCLPFRTDEIDKCLLDVHQNFRPVVQRRGSKISPTKTVFHYVEQKIEARELIPDPIFPQDMSIVPFQRR